MFAPAQSQAPAKQAIPEDKKACGFINIYAPTASGGRKKVGTIALKKSDPREKAVADALLPEESREEMLKRFVSVLQFEFNPFDDSNAAADTFVF